MHEQNLRFRLLCRLLLRSIGEGKMAMVLSDVSQSEMVESQQSHTFGKIVAKTSISSLLAVGEWVQSKNMLALPIIAIKFI